MDDDDRSVRTKLFISKATPGDDAFALWIAPRLENAGYEVFADILHLDTGDSWRRKLTTSLQNESAKLLLCCSNETLSREGVFQEIGIAAALSKSLDDQNFILPLKLRSYKPVFGIVDLQYIDFEKGWADGLAKLLKSLDSQKVPKKSKPRIQPEWAAYHQRRAIKLLNEPEVLTSNWLRILSVPDEVRYIVPKGALEQSRLKKASAGFPYPIIPYGEGFITFANSFDADEHFSSMATFEYAGEIKFSEFLEDGYEAIGVADREARNMVVNLLRQAWEIHCKNEGFYAHEFSNGLAQIVGHEKMDLGKRIPWGKQGQRRNSMLRNTARGKVWEYGVSARAHLFPFPHYRLKSRVLFLDVEEDETTTIIDSFRVQHRLRRSIAGSWRNKAWHGRLMAFMEVLAGESPYVALPVRSDAHIYVDGMPIQATSPVTARQTNKLGEDGEEIDVTTLGGHFDEEEA